MKYEIVVAVMPKYSCQYKPKAKTLLSQSKQTGKPNHTKQNVKITLSFISFFVDFGNIMKSKFIKYSKYKKVGKCHKSF